MDILTSVPLRSTIMEAVHPLAGPAIQRVAALVASAAGLPGRGWRWRPGAAAREAQADGTRASALDTAALADLGMPARALSSREQAARLWQRAGHG
jgi:hypothetical protein